MPKLCVSAIIYMYIWVEGIDGNYRYAICGPWQEHSADLLNYKFMCRAQNNF